jgi:hypothetical protein
LVGTAGFEPATPCTPSKCATRLRYVPMKSAAEDDSVGFDLQILHQSAATGEDARSSIDKDPLRQELTNFLSSVFRVEHALQRPSVTNGA